MAIHFLQKFDLSKYTLKNFGNAAEIVVDTNDGQSLKFNKAGSTVTILDGGINTPNLVTAATLTAAAGSAGARTYFLGSTTGTTVTLPLATGSGNRITFHQSATLASGNNIIQTAASTDFMRGQIFASTDNGSGAGLTWPCATTGTLATESDTITLNGGSKGGHAGDRLEFVDITTNVWAIAGFVGQTGTEATPFTAAV